MSRNIYFTGNNITKNFTRAEYMRANRATDSKIRFYPETFIFATAIQMFRDRIGKPMLVNCWFRTPEFNKRCGGIATSNHLKGCAMDFYFKGENMADEKKFIEYANIWKDIINIINCTDIFSDIQGEAGLYRGFWHFGIQHYSKSFYHWDTRTGKQINMPFKGKL